MKTPSLRWPGTVLVLLALCVSLPLKAQNNRQDEPRKNYVMLHVGLFPTDYPIYKYNGDELYIDDAYRYFGPVFGLTYGRQFNDFLAAEGHLFFSFITRSDIPNEVSPYNYRTTRYGANAGLIVTPLGRWFRYFRVGAVLGYVREDERKDWVWLQQKKIHRTSSVNHLAINYPIRLYALDSRKYALCAEVNLQYELVDKNHLTGRTVNYTINFAYKF